ncbi:MAG: hypothetical protein DHS20C13_18600 [Thermodesulfobacteriota bacterium]|nr:MAG: hypothetical protein DHS20C13_18600 [Thermodesulfobacteriota bacterium]
MRFFISADIKKNTLLKLIVAFTVLFFLFLWITNLLLYLQIGFSYESVVQYYLGSEEDFRPARSYLGMLEEAHFHFFAMAIILVTLNHLILFTKISNFWKLVLILLSYLSALGDIAGGWLIRYVSPEFAYLKIASLIGLQVSLAVLMIIVIWFLYGYSDKKTSYG